MATHESLIRDIEAHCERLLSRIDDLKRYLVSAEGLASTDADKWDFLTREARGTAIVCAVAELESLAQQTIRRTHEELNASTLTLKEIRACMRRIAVHDSFESLRTLNDHDKVWKVRCFTTTLDLSLDVVRLPTPTKGPQPPLDGRTLRPGHFYRIWEVYGLPDVAFPVVAWSMSLQKLAGLRNDIAHGELPYPDIFKQAGVSSGEIELYIDHVALLALHFTEQWCRFLTEEMYMEKVVAVSGAASE